MHQTFSMKQKTSQFLAILLPILVTQVTMFAMSFFDTVMSGHASAIDLAGVAIGSSIWAPISTGLGGIFIAITPLVSHLVGAKKDEDVPYKVFQGVLLALFISAFIILLGSITLDRILSLMDLEVSVRAIARGYLIVLALGIPPLFIYQVLRSFIDALGRTRVSMIIALLSLPTNVTLNYIFIYGKLGLPAYGGIGAGIATALTYWLMAFLATCIVIRDPSFSRYHIFKHVYPISLKAWREQLKIGIPIGFSIFFETSIFAAVTLLMSGFNTVTIAGHQGAMNFASMLYMVPLSSSMALTILIGFEVGARRFRDARNYALLGLGISLILALLTAVGLLLFRAQIAGFYSKELEVIKLTQQFLIYALFFQFSDAIATPIQGILRGYKDVNVPFLSSLLSYWLFALPVGYLLAHFTSFGAFGYWIGLISGISLNALCLAIRLRHIQRQKAFSH